jgi:nitrate/nitrite-specific signal transduction histidine kinase
MLSQKDIKCTQRPANYRIINYAEPCFQLQIKKDNDRYSERLEKIKKPKLKATFRYDSIYDPSIIRRQTMRARCYKSMKQQEALIKDNRRIFKNLIDIKVTETLSTKYHQNEFKNFLLYKERRTLARNQKYFAF